MSRGVWTVAVCVAIACTGSLTPSRRSAVEAMSDGDLDTAQARMEQRRDADPMDTSRHDDLGELYYKRARIALDEKRFDDYERYLELALNEWIVSLKLDPTASDPHLWMGIVSAYQGDLDRALVSFKNAHRLGRGNPIHDTNLAEIYVYRGELPKARRYLERGQRGGAPDVVVEITGALAAWRDGDLTEARDLFETAYALDPVEVNTWNEAPVAKPIESFEDFTSYCCGHLACGPYMRSECVAMEQSVAERELRDETIRRELILEMERRRELERIYRDRRDLNITVEEVDKVEEVEE